MTRHRARGSRGWAVRLGAGILGVLVVLACSGGLDEAALVAPAEQQLSQGDLPGAAATYAQLWADNPSSVAVAVGFAYTQLLAGDIVGADTTLAEIEAQAGERVGEIRLRRALVALAADNLDRVKMLGEQSGLPEGKLLAAEVHLVDLRSDEAVKLLQEVEGVGGVVGDTAKTYLALVQSGDQHKASLAEASALWALGDRAGATDAVKDSLKAMDNADPDKDDLLLLWAGRAVSSGRPAVARSLLEDIPFPPEGQRWRMTATEAMVDVAEGRIELGIDKLRAMWSDPTVPRQGVEDAMVTACLAIRDPALATRLLDGVESAGAARCLAELGVDGAASRAPEGPLRNFLENR